MSRPYRSVNPITHGGQQARFRAAWFNDASVETLCDLFRATPAQIYRWRKVLGFQTRDIDVRPRKEKHLSMYLSVEDHSALGRASCSKGLSMSEYVRRLIAADARRFRAQGQ